MDVSPAGAGDRREAASPVHQRIPLRTAGAGKRGLCPAVLVFLHPFRDRRPVWHERRSGAAELGADGKGAEAVSAGAGASPAGRHGVPPPSMA